MIENEKSIKKHKGRKKEKGKRKEEDGKRFVNECTSAMQRPTCERKREREGVRWEGGRDGRKEEEEGSARGKARSMESGIIADVDWLKESTRRRSFTLLM